MNINEWLKQNAITIVITVSGAVASFTLYGYRIDALEKQQASAEVAIQALNTQQNQINVQLAQISTDIQYIKVNIDRLFGRGNQQ